MDFSKEKDSSRVAVSSQPPLSEIKQYIVKPTDTLTGIALAHGMKPEKIKKINQLHSDVLIPGQVQIIFLKKNQKD